MEEMASSLGDEKLSTWDENLPDCHTSEITYNLSGGNFTVEWGGPIVVKVKLLDKCIHGKIYDLEVACRQPSMARLWGTGLQPCTTGLEQGVSIEEIATIYMILHAKTFQMESASNPSIFPCLPALNIHILSCKLQTIHPDAQYMQSGLLFPVPLQRPFYQASCLNVTGFKKCVGSPLLRTLKNQT